MKTITLFLSLIVILAACNKNNNNQPTPSQTNTPNNPIDTTGNGNGNDTIGKVKVYFAVSLNYANTPISNYNQDTSNTRIFHNATVVKGFYSNYIGSNLVALTNFNVGAPNPTITPKPIWMAHGDSIIFEMDHLEYSANDPQGFNPYHWNTFKVYSAPTLTSQLNGCCQKIWDINLATTAPNTDLNLGSSTDGQSTQVFNWYLGRKYRNVFVIP